MNSGVEGIPAVHGREEVNDHPQLILGQHIRGVSPSPSSGWSRLGSGCPAVTRTWPNQDAYPVPADGWPVLDLDTAGRAMGFNEG